MTLIKNPKSYNSQIGVPLSVWNIEHSHTLGIFEAGISRSNEMQNLEQMIRPSIGILTNIGEAHQINFESLEEKLNEKLKLFYRSDVLLVNYSLFKKYPNQFLQLESRNPKLVFITWDDNDSADINVHYIEKESVLHLKYLQKECSIHINFRDSFYLENMIICLCTLLYLKEDISKIVDKINSLRPIEMRLEKIEGIHDITLINDTYNADKDSLKIALEFLQNQGNGKKSVIISEIENLSSSEIFSLLTPISLSRIIYIGDSLFDVDSDHILQPFQPISQFKSADEFIKNYPHAELRNQTVLVKGSRKFEFEKIVEFYKKKTHTTYLKVHLNALKNNLNEFSKLLKPSTKMMVMLKAQGYGLGSIELAKMLEGKNVDYFAVAYTDEAIELRQAGIHTAMMIMNTDLKSLSKIVEYQLEPEVYSLNFLKALLTQFHGLVNGNSLSLNIHLKIETGMNRLGIGEEDTEEVIRLLLENKNITVRSIMSHLASSDDPIFDDFTKEQISKFNRIAHQIETLLGYSAIKHILNTGGILRHSEFQLDMVRLGIGLFGSDSTHQIQSKLQNTISLLSKISQIKTVIKGDTIGYSRGAKVNRNSTIAVISIGYADGYSRKFGNGHARVFINNQYFPTIGNVCMDMIMVDITNGIHIEEGDEVELIGDHISVSELASIAETIPYEIITSISSRVQRIYYED